MNKTPAPKQITGMRRLSFYTASPVECCDRCGQGIKHVAIVEFKDGTHQKFGLDCINKILSGDTSLKSVFAKNQKLLKTYTTNLEIISRPFDEMPIDKSGYYDRGIYMIADDSGKMIFQNGHYLFHPTKADDKFFGHLPGCTDTLDMRPIGSAWEPKTRENWKAKNVHAIEADKVWLASEIERISTFLARVLNNAVAKASVQS